MRALHFLTWHQGDRLETAPALEIHYYLKDDLHSIDAALLHKCEGEALSAFLYIAERLGFDVVLEATVATEGGYRQIWKFVKNPKNLGVTTVLATTLIGGATVATSLLNTLVTAAVTIWVAPAKPDAALEALQAELLRKSIEEKALEIKAKTLAYEDALEQRSQKKTPQQPQDPAVDSGAPTDRQAEPQPSLQTDLRVVTRRTNFYKSLLPYSRVTGIGYGWIAPGDETLSEHRYVDRREFIDFIRPVEQVEPRIVPDAIIQLVAPVLRDSELKWRGIFEGSSIAFDMKDNDFKAGVLRKGVQFQNGDAITCLLHVKFKVNEVGEKVVAGHEVYTVHQLMRGNEARRALANKKVAEIQEPQAQLSLNLNYNAE